MNQNQNVELLETLLVSIKNRGYKNTLNMLESNHKVSEIADGYESYVIDAICEKFTITREDLLYSRYVRGERKYAIGFCVHYLYQKMSLGEIRKNIFKNKNKALLTRYRQMILDLKKNDLAYLEIRNDLDKKIENFK
jgi:hypothetical protein